MHPLIPDRTMSFSSSLAATIGLNEAVMLTWLNECVVILAADGAHGGPWQVPNNSLRAAMPFWDDDQLRQVLRSLHEKGVVQLSSVLFPESDPLTFHFGQTSAMTDNRVSEPVPQVNAAHVRQQSSAQPVQSDWHPSRDALMRLAQHGVPDSYSLSQLDAFILQAKEQRNHRNDWDTQFFRFVKKHWVYTQTDAHKAQRRLAEKAAFNVTTPERNERFQAPVSEAAPMGHHWQPSADAQLILQRAGIETQFIHDAIPEFVLYWQERGDAHKTWNTKFIQHVRQQWARYSATVDQSHMPTRINDDWQPAADCFDILAMAHIEVNFAKNLVKEFVLYWRDSNQLHTSWNSKFLQYVKHQWGRQLNQPGHMQNGESAHGAAKTQSGVEPGYTTAAASRQRLNDTSW